MTASLVSIVVPVHNGAAFLAEALDSILGQTYPALEVIVVDDGSTDGTPRVLDAYAGRVRRLWQANQGPARARNAAVAQARGELLAFCDADDVWHPHKLERQVAGLRAHSAAGYSVTWMKHFWIPELQDEAQAFRHHAFGGPMLGYLVSGLVARRWAMAHVGLFDPARGEDTDWFIRARELRVPFDTVDEVLWSRRLHRHNLSRGSRIPAKLVMTLKASLDRRRTAGEVLPGERL